MPKIVAIHWRKFERFLFSIGCTLDRQEGDHRIYKKPGIKRPLVVPMWRPLPVFIIKSNLNTLSIDHGEYLEKLDKL